MPEFKIFWFDDSTLPYAIYLVSHNCKYNCFKVGLRGSQMTSLDRRWRGGGADGQITGGKLWEHLE